MAPCLPQLLSNSTLDNILESVKHSLAQQVLLLANIAGSGRGSQEDWFMQFGVNFFGAASQHEFAQLVRRAGQTRVVLFCPPHPPCAVGPPAGLAPPPGASPPPPRAPPHPA